MTLRDLIAKWREQATSEHLKASAEVKAWRNQRGLMLTQCADELEAFLKRPYLAPVLGADEAGQTYYDLIEQELVIHDD